MGFLVNRVTVVQACSRVSVFSPVSIISPTLHAHSVVLCLRDVILSVDSVVKQLILTYTSDFVRAFSYLAPQSKVTEPWFGHRTWYRLQVG